VLLVFYLIFLKCFNCIAAHQRRVNNKSVMFVIIIIAPLDVFGVMTDILNILMGLLCFIQVGSGGGGGVTSTHPTHGRLSSLLIIVNDI
jgi:hypothetical protein